MNPFRLWMLKASTIEQKTLAKEAGVSHVYLYQLADKMKNASSATAGRIASAAEAIRKLSKGRLPKITRADLAIACANCEYAQRCIRRRKS